ncbi:MAG TPA: DUF6515 family protein [Steroidobacteraceae bacterium]|nr:DUF6515 family protein [Steroidobacteraceae bacterium]
MAQEPLRSEPAFVPYHVHRDMRNGHDHVYPDRGSIVRDAPRDSLVVNYAGISYRFHDGVWLEPRGPAYMVVAPPIGLIVQTLPAFATSVRGSGGALLYANEVFYRARPDVGGYEVVNDPLQDPAPRAPAPLPTPAQMAPAPVATPIPAVAAVAPVPAQISPAVPVPTAAPQPAAMSSAAMPPAAMPVAQPVQQPAAPQPNTGGAGAAEPAVWATAAPSKGQSADVQARDSYDCYQFAVAQTGFDPLRANGGVPPGQTAEKKAAYARAQAACFEGRGYSVH